MARSRTRLQAAMLAAVTMAWPARDAQAEPFPTTLDALVHSAFGSSEPPALAPLPPPTEAPVTSSATPEAPKPPEPPPAPKKEHWYERFNIGGYTQVRFNRLYASNDELRNDQGDKSIGGGNGFLIRRARLRISGDVGEHLSFYFQPDFAAGTAGDTNHLVQMRDWYGDVIIDERKEYRFRIGQSKVPYGFENMQSSQNRAPFDRSDAINSAVKDERDLGVFFYFAPEAVRKRFKHLVESGLKGSGDYGMLALGIYNGQTANQRERNDNRHVIARVTYPFQIGEQFVELGGGGYIGEFYVKKSSENVLGDPNQRDARAHVSFILYPQPFGLQAEYNIGIGPELVGNELRDEPLHGGYVMAMVRFGGLLPYVRIQSYDGAKKHEVDAPRHEVREIEGGIEWQILKPIELTAAYMASDRTINGVRQTGELARLQLQLNY